MAKIFHSGMERMLVVYLRSLGSAMEDALIVADPRPADAIHQAWHSGVLVVVIVVVQLLKGIVPSHEQVILLYTLYCYMILILYIERDSRLLPVIGRAACSQALVCVTKGYLGNCTKSGSGYVRVPHQCRSYFPTSGLHWTPKRLRIHVACAKGRHDR